MSYDEALAFWYDRINYEVRAAQPSDLKLERMRALLRLLGDPHDRVRLVHVTGTKGKGSTCAMLAAVLRAAGYRVGLFTSPHLEHVEERIQVDGVPILPTELATRMDEVAAAVRQLETCRRRPSPSSRSGRRSVFCTSGIADVTSRSSRSDWVAGSTPPTSAPPWSLSSPMSDSTTWLSSATRLNR